MPRALIVWGGWPGHKPEVCATIFAGVLRGAGMDVAISNSLDSLLALQGIDLVVPIWTMGALIEAQETSLVNSVREGTGMAGFHGGMGDAFPASRPYNWMVGGQFVAHPDDITEYEVNIARREDPIVQGLHDFKVTSEQYYMHVDPSNEVLATTTFRTRSAPWINGTVMPVVWKRRWGQGRVFYSSVGHSPNDFDVPEAMEIQRRGMLWAVRG